MRLRAYRYAAASSLGVVALALCAASQAETRPHYGGTLRVQLISMFANPEQLPLASETLVRIDEHGGIEPSLARGWQSERNRWRFLLRVKAASPAGVAAALAPLVKKWYGDSATATATPSSVIVQADRAMPDLLERLAQPDAGIPGTGPFRVSKWEPGRRALLEANEDYPGGRPFVDAVEFTVAPARVSAYQISSADIWELPVGVSRRLIPDGMRIWTSRPLDLIALWLRNPLPALREALSLSIDRAAIVNVLTQRRGEVASGLLPQWLSGYEFVFPAPFDPTRAREMVRMAKIGALALSYPPSDPLVRSVADRVMVNARDAGLTLRIAAHDGNADVEVRHVRLDCDGADRALREISGSPEPGDLGSAEALYHAERAVLDEGRIIPLLHVPDVFGIGPRVHTSAVEGLPNCDLLGAIPNLWLSP